MVGYILLGASIGAVVGYLIPPGSLFWLSMGSVGGYVARQYIDATSILKQTIQTFVWFFLR